MLFVLALLLASPSWAAPDDSPDDGVSWIEELETLSTPPAPCATEPSVAEFSKRSLALVTRIPRIVARLRTITEQAAEDASMAQTHAVAMLTLSSSLQLYAQTLRSADSCEAGDYLAQAEQAERLSEQARVALTRDVQAWSSSWTAEETASVCAELPQDLLLNHPIEACAAP